MTDRREDARRREEMAAAARRLEADDAQAIIDEFVAEAGRRHLASEPLKATTYSGQTVKTDRRGWYLNRRRSLAIGDDGAYLRLVIPDVGTFARFTGVKITPELPPLMVAANGKDGEGGALTWFIERVLAGHQDG